MWIFLLLIGLNGFISEAKQRENDESSRKILGSSVVTSVSVIMDKNNDSSTPTLTDAVGKPVISSRPHLTRVASPIELLNPDRYEFYTFSETGDLVKRMMTMEEIRTIIATSGDDVFNIDNISDIMPEKNVNDIVSNVQNVLKEEMEAHKVPDTNQLYFDTPDVSDTWSMILPAVFGSKPDESASATSERTTPFSRFTEYFLTSSPMTTPISNATTNPLKVQVYPNSNTNFDEFSTNHLVRTPKPQIAIESRVSSTIVEHTSPVYWKKSATTRKTAEIPTKPSTSTTQKIYILLRPLPDLNATTTTFSPPTTLKRLPSTESIFTTFHQKPIVTSFKTSTTRKQPTTTKADITTTTTTSSTEKHSTPSNIENLTKYFGTPSRLNVHTTSYNVKTSQSKRPPLQETSPLLDYSYFTTVQHSTIPSVLRQSLGYSATIEALTKYLSSSKPATPSSTTEREIPHRTETNFTRAASTESPIAPYQEDEYLYLPTSSAYISPESTTDAPTTEEINSTTEKSADIISTASSKSTNAPSTTTEFDETKTAMTITTQIPQQETATTAFEVVKNQTFFENFDQVLAQAVKNISEVLAESTTTTENSQETIETISTTTTFTETTTALPSSSLLNDRIINVTMMRNKADLSLENDYEMDSSTTTSAPSTNSVSGNSQNDTEDVSWMLVSTISPDDFAKNATATTMQSQTVEPAKPTLAPILEPTLPIELETKPIMGFGLEESTSKLDSDIYNFVQLCNELAFNFWKSVTTGISTARSVVVSPFAATSLLAMVFLGARGSTSNEMNEILQLDNMVTFNPHLIFKTVTESVLVGPEFGVANHAIVRQLYSDKSREGILNFYKERAKFFYDGHVEEVSFREIGDTIRRRTNLLVKKQTNGRVQEFLKDGSVRVNAPLAAVSASLMQTDCSKGSSSERDGELFFVVFPSIKQRRLIPIPAVVYRSNFLAGYEASLDATAVALGTKDDVISYIFVLPGRQSVGDFGDGLARLEKRLVESSFQKGAWGRLLRTLVPRPGLEVQIPKFSHRSIINATVALKQMGLKQLFDTTDADLRGLNGVAHDLHLSDVLQFNQFSVCGNVNENIHAEFYPATSRRSLRKHRRLDLVDERKILHDDPLYIIDYLSLPLSLRPRQARVPQVPRLRLDRPFLYFVRHNPTGLILHMGRFNPRLLP